MPRLQASTKQCAQASKRYLPTCVGRRWAPAQQCRRRGSGAPGPPFFFFCVHFFFFPPDLLPGLPGEVHDVRAVPAQGDDLSN